MYSVQTDQRRLKRDCTPNDPYCKSLDRPILKPRPVKTNSLTLKYVWVFMFMCVCVCVYDGRRLSVKVLCHV